MGCGAREVVCTAEHGEGAHVLTSTAESAGGDLIGVGSKGRVWPARFLLGDLPDEVSHHAPCDVLVVHTSD